MPRLLPHRLTRLAALLLVASTATQAQEAPRLERVEVTGSTIKRLDAETALPVQVLRKEDIQKSGATTAAELVSMLAATANNLGDGISMANGGFRDQMGFNAVNLRGLGVSSTLVLLNGRRMANFASPGDDVGVDLNNIPAAAIERIEILLDGASATYGSDAIGGVMNFITKRNFQGIQGEVYGYRTQEGGAGKRTASLTWGAGDVVRDRFNLLAVLDWQSADALDTSQRQFISDLKIPERLPHLLSSAGFPANIRLSRAQRNFLQDQGFRINGKEIENRTINLSVPNCLPPHTLYLPAGIGGVDGCTYDFMRDVELYPKSDRMGLLSRGVMDLGGGAQMFAELSMGRAKTLYTGTSNRIDADVPSSLIPLLAATGMPTDPDLDEPDVVVRTRMLEAGKRGSELTSTGTRAVLGFSGQAAGWEYELSVLGASNKVSERDVRGYLREAPVLAGFYSGAINPFGPSSQAGLQILRDAQINEEVRSARGTTRSLQSSMSRGLAQLEGGELMVSMGAELRRESTKSRASDLLISDQIVGDPSPGDAQTTDRGRRMWAVYGEMVAPLTKALELNAALRHDRYQTVGGSTTPKLGLRWVASPTLLVRASAGTGFRAPSVNDLYRPVKTSQTAVLPDPVCMAENDNDLSFCADFWETRTYANPNLKPEKSNQQSIGFVFQPSKRASLSVDWWAITKRNLISTIGDDVILANLAKYEPLVHRYNEDEGLAGCDYDPDDSTICFIELQKENRGQQKLSGIDLQAEWQGPATALGRFGIKLSGTYALESKKQTGNGDPYISNLGRFVTDGVVQRWRHRLTLDWSAGAWNVALSNTYRTGHLDQNSAIDTDSGTVVAPNRVKAYSLWDLSARWQATPQVALRAGVRNLLDTPPPYSNQAFFFLSGYDPSYTDPRGRAFSLSLNFALR
ncbi:MAG: TonB-dependent receptor [Burkholderiales bacterium]|nr:TonB-dependent receptor [Burkholderiales bacterium]